MAPRKERLYDLVVKVRVTHVRARDPKHAAEAVAPEDGGRA